MSAVAHSHPEPDCTAVADALGAGPAGAGAEVPAAPVRGARWLAAGDRVFTAADSLWERGATRALNPLAQLGPAANAMLLLATLSGILLLVWYSPSVQFAWSSLAGLPGRSVGGLVRSVHRYASDLALLFVLLHGARTFLARKFAGARWLAWASGLAMLGLVWLIGWTGYWLVWDQRAQLVATSTMKAIDVLPVFGEPMLPLFSRDHTVPSLLFFVVFFLHMVLPLAIAGGLALHLARLSRSRLLPDRRLTAWLVGAVVLAAVAFPATSAAPAHMAVKPAAFTMDWWYLWPLALTARFSGAGIWLAAGLAGAGVLTVPWWLARRRRPESLQATVNLARCFSCTLCSQDCPFGAITMVPRTDGKPWPAQAQVDPDRCVGCGVCAGACDTQAIGLPWFDAQRVARDLETLVADGAGRGAPPAIALVCAQDDGGWNDFDPAAWRLRLPGYSVQPIPCAGWVEPKLVERLLGKGARAVLVVGCSSSEASCREGNVWLPARLEGTREPAFRPARADARRKAYAAFDPLRPHLLTGAALRLLAPAAGALPPVRAGSRVPALLLGGALLGGLLLLSAAPFRNPAPAGPELVFTFRALGEWADVAPGSVPAAEDKRPIHMRSQQPAHRSRQPVTIRLRLDDREETHVYRPKGIAADGASVGELRRALGPGRHRVGVDVVTAADRPDAARTWSIEFEAQEGRHHVLSFDPVAGFAWEP